MSNRRVAVATNTEIHGVSPLVNKKYTRADRNRCKIRETRINKEKFAFRLSSSTVFSNHAANVTSREPLVEQATRFDRSNVQTVIYVFHSGIPVNLIHDRPWNNSTSLRTAFGEMFFLGAVVVPTAKETRTYRTRRDD